MKRTTLLLIVLLGLFFRLNAEVTEIDISQKPEPLPENEFKFPEYKQVTLDNGLKLFVIEDHEQPTIALRLLVAGGKSVDALKPGVAEITAGLLTKGTKKMNALDIAKKIDGVGASIPANASTDFITVNASGLTKHIDVILNVFSQVITAPVFPEDEFEKIIPQMLANIRQEKGDPRAIAQKMSRKVIYGENHPYALDPTESSIKNINIADIKKYFGKYFVPGNATLTVIGDVNSDEIISDIEEKFENWKESKESVEIINPAAKSMPLGVYFIERPGSVQSTIVYTSKAVPFNNRAYDELEIATSVISGGIAGRLFRTIREKYSYAYSPFGYLSQGKYSSRYVCGADVKNIVTDSAIIVILDQIRTLATVKPSKEELERVKIYKAGSYKMSFENSGFIAAAIQNADFYGKPVDDLETYATRIMTYTPYGIKEVASRYLNPKKGYIIVVGSPEIKDKLNQFGKVYDYDLDFNPLSGENAKMEEVSYDAAELIEEYVEALGGMEALNNIQTVIDTAKIEMITNGNASEGLLIQYQKAPNKKHFIFDMIAYKQEGWIDGENVWVKLDKVEKMQGTNAEMFLYDAILFKDTKILENGYTCEVLGKQGNRILMKAVSPKGLASTYYFDSETFLLKKIERVEETSHGTLPITERITEYVEINGVKFPKVIETVNPLYNIKTINNYTVNTPLDDAMFKPE
ncbi:insulinase family protein [Bacteroidota bacterium]